MELWYPELFLRIVLFNKSSEIVEENKKGGGGRYIGVEEKTLKLQMF